VGRIVVLVLFVAGAAVAAGVALAARSPQQWRAAMHAAASAKHSVHYVSTSSEPGGALRMVADVGQGRGIQRITVTTGGQSGPATVLVVGRSAYIRGNTFTLHNYFAFSEAQATSYAGKWISVPSTLRAFSAVAADATFASFLSDLLPHKHLAVLRTTIAGRKSVGLRGTVLQGGVKVAETVYAPAGGTPLPFEETVAPAGKPGTGRVRMSRWNEAVHLTAPAHAVPISTVLGR
jgi:hypothetical protein